eukprot:5901363-Alexandrium_andersonii.AAC.1
MASGGLWWLLVACECHAVPGLALRGLGMHWDASGWPWEAVGGLAGLGLLWIALGCLGRA